MAAQRGSEFYRRPHVALLRFPVPSAFGFLSGNMFYVFFYCRIYYIRSFLPLVVVLELERAAKKSNITASLQLCDRDRAMIRRSRS